MEWFLISEDLNIKKNEAMEEMKERRRRRQRDQTWSKIHKSNVQKINSFNFQIVFERGG